MTDAERIVELEAEVEYLKRELGLILDGDQVLRLREVLRLSPTQAQTVLALYLAKGRVLSLAQLDERVPAPTAGDDREESYFRVVTRKIRIILGPGIIETVWGLGYRITGRGELLVAAALGEPQDLAA
jgi:DNA-binding response OmpR family regulator